jgi:hypothetical protein
MAEPSFAPLQLMSFPDTLPVIAVGWLIVTVVDTEQLLESVTVTE